VLLVFILRVSCARYSGMGRPSGSCPANVVAKCANCVENRSRLANKRAQTQLFGAAILQQLLHVPMRRGIIHRSPETRLY
jgi:hypothetical protein